MRGRLAALDKSSGLSHGDISPLGALGEKQGPTRFPHLNYLWKGGNATRPVRIWGERRPSAARKRLGFSDPPPRMFECRVATRQQAGGFTQPGFLPPLLANRKQPLRSRADNNKKIKSSRAKFCPARRRSPVPRYKRAPNTGTGTTTRERLRGETRSKPTHQLRSKFHFITGVIPKLASPAMFVI